MSHDLESGWNQEESVNYTCISKFIQTLTEMRIIGKVDVS